MRHGVVIVAATVADTVVVIITSGQSNLTLEMWASAQRDGRPAEYTWRRRGTKVP